MVEIHKHRDHPQSMDERVRARTKNSGDTAHADHVVTGDKGIRTNIHNSRVQQYGADHPGEGDIFGNPRGPANTRGQIP
jgi:hypothetical protein